MIPSNWNSNEEIDEFDIELKVIIRTWKLGKKLLDNFKCYFFPFRCSSSCWQQLWKVGWVPDAAAAELAAAQEALCTVDEDSKNRSCSLSPLSLSICLSLSLLLSSSSFYTLPFRFPRRLCTAANARHPQRTPHRLKPHGGKTRGRNRRIHQHFTVRSFTAPSPAHTHTLTHWGTHPHTRCYQGSTHIHTQLDTGYALC